MGEVPERSGGDGGRSFVPCWRRLVPPIERFAPTIRVAGYLPRFGSNPQAGEGKIGVCMNKRIKIKPDSFFPHLWGKCRSVAPQGHSQKVAEAMGGLMCVLCQTEICPPIPPTGYFPRIRGKKVEGA